MLPAKPRKLRLLGQRQYVSKLGISSYLEQTRNYYHIIFFKSHSRITNVSDSCQSLDLLDLSKLKSLHLSDLFIFQIFSSLRSEYLSDLSEISDFKNALPDFSVLFTTFNLFFLFL